MIFRHTVSRASRAKHSLPPLPYPYSGLEPFIKRELLETHHKHHAAHVDLLNEAEEELSSAYAAGDIKTIIGLGPTLKFNGGGHINHCIFWKNLTDDANNPPAFFEKIVKKEFGSWFNLQNELSGATIGIQGSGWGWLGYNRKLKRMQIATCPNQDPLETTTGLIPLLGIDAWEHAYYSQFKSARAEYVRALFHVINWVDVADRYKEAEALDFYPTIKS